MTAIETLRRRVPASILALLAPPIRPSLSRWVEESRYVPKGPMKGYWSNRNMPLCIEIYRLIESGRYFRFIVMAAAQSGKSEIMTINNLLADLARGEDCALCFPTKEALKSFWNEKIAPSIWRMPKLLENFPKEIRRSLHDLEFRGEPSPITLLNGAVFHPIWAGSVSMMSSKTIPNLYIEEVVKYAEGGTAGGEATAPYQIFERAAAFENSRVYLACTVTDSQSFIWREFLAASQGLCHVPCPKCGRGIVLEFDGEKAQKAFPDRPKNFTSLRYDDTNAVTAEKTAELECGLCGKTFGNDERLNALENPSWLYQGQRMEGKRIVGEMPQTRTLSYRWNRLYFPCRSLGSMAAEHWKARQDEEGLKGFQIYSECLPWEPEMDFREVSMTALRARAMRTGTRRYFLGEIPDWVEFLIGAFDIQLRAAKGVLYGFKRDMTRALIEPFYWNFETPSGQQNPSEAAIESALVEIRERCRRGWTRMRADGETEILTPRLIGLDVGEGKRTTFLRNAIRRLGQPLAAVRGIGVSQDLRGGVGPAKTIEGAKSDANKIQGVIEVRKQPDAQWIYFVQTKSVQAEFLDSFLVPEGTPGYHDLPLGGLDPRKRKFWGMVEPRADRSEVLREYTNEQRQAVEKGAGFSVEWKRKSSAAKIDYLHAAVYTHALARYFIHRLEIAERGKTDRARYAEAKAYRGPGK